LIISAVEAFNEGKVEEPACTSWHPAHTSNKSRRSNRNEREDASMEFLHVADNAADWIPLQKTGLIRKSNFQRMLALTFEGQKLFRKHENVQEQL
jgi:hypothetical protein